MLKWTEPDDARKPVDRWRIYEYKNGEQVKILHIHRQSAFLVGRIKGHCGHPDDASVLQRPARGAAVSPQSPEGRFDEVRVVLPYVMDLESTNGTFLNGERLAPARYVELREKDMLKFGSSSRAVLIRAPASANAPPTRVASWDSRTTKTDNKSGRRVSGPRRRPRRGPRPSRPLEHISPGGASQTRGEAPRERLERVGAVGPQ